ncbi:hypothetical protein Tco_1380639, partial [Tanacetum coccineum]
KKQKVQDDKETAKLKQLMKIIPDEEEVAIDVMPLAVKSPKLVQETTNNKIKPLELKFMIKKCFANANLHVPLEEIKVGKTLRFVKEPIELSDRGVKKLKCSRILILKLLNMFEIVEVEDFDISFHFIATYDAFKEAVWVRKFIYGLGVVPTIEEPINMYCDNTGAITIANESGITKGARHFRAKVHYLREVIEFGDVKLEKVHTDDNLADPFTKALAFSKHS